MKYERELAMKMGLSQLDRRGGIEYTKHLEISGGKFGQEALTCRLLMGHEGYSRLCSVLIFAGYEPVAHSDFSIDAGEASCVYRLDKLVNTPSGVLYIKPYLFTPYFGLEVVWDYRQRGIGALVWAIGSAVVIAEGAKTIDIDVDLTHGEKRRDTSFYDQYGAIPVSASNVKYHAKKIPGELSTNQVQILTEAFNIG